ncbi:MULTISPECIES: DUF1835 domain-containing protein [Bacillus]|uniref:DUF1835 domain-containing protein n=1 Tax=Bacillus TaxID=1386 RepID=UPI00032EE4FC|nr:DUF1835 domain-containing protein [Bacillus pseudomycoides]EOP54317.1 hypothetical protein IIW_01590 [Bacillus cereus VD136]OOG92764.1 hypothetical protein BTH41_04786 [Bacillus mycoides]PEK58702.1 hypothetical protein CN590_25985 [Bacillus pseudomycoides]PEL33285.1 hypothetical protein CN608_02825 [Bacillus pseudomycoides]
MIEKIEKIKKVVNDMQEDEAKHLLQSILIQLDLLKKDYNEDLITYLTSIPKQLINPTPYKKEITESTHVHITFDESSAGSLKHMLSKERLRQEYVVSFSEFFSIGPINQLDTNEGQQLRQQWLSKNLNLEDLYFEEEYLSQFIQSLEELQSIPNDMPITIWSANNAHEHVGLCFALVYLKDKKNIRIINTSEAHRRLFQKENEIYEIRGTGELTSEKLAVIYEKYEKGAVLTEEERTGFEQEWELLSETTDLLRIWNDNQVQSVHDDYFDTFIIECAKNLEKERAEEQFYKSARLIGEVLGQIEQSVGDVFLEYRLRTLIGQGVFEMKGSLKAMRYYSVRLKK